LLSLRSSQKQTVTNSHLSLPDYKEYTPKSTK